MYSEAQRHCLLEIARTTIELSVRNDTCTLHQIETNDEELLQPRGNFVTLTLNSNLRGCIGSLEGNGTLIHSVAEHAWSAAFKDPRFPPVRSHELEILGVSISILTPKEIVPFSTETELLESLRPGVDGLLIEKGKHHATFLPSVWDSLPSPIQFLQQLKLKSGMNPDDIPEMAWRYTAISFSDKD